MNSLIKSISNSILILLIINSCNNKKVIPTEIIGKYQSVDYSSEKSYILLSNNGEFEWIGSKNNILASGTYTAKETGPWNNGSNAWNIFIKIDKQIETYGDIFHNNASVILHDKHSLTPGEKDYYRFDLNGSVDGEWIKNK